MIINNFLCYSFYKNIMNKNILTSYTNFDKGNIQEEILDNLYVAIIGEYDDFNTDTDTEEVNLLNSTFISYATSKLEAYRQIIMIHANLFTIYIEYLYDKKKEVKNLVDDISLLYKNSNNIDVLEYIFYHIYQYILYYLCKGCKKENIIEYEKYIILIRKTIYLCNLKEFEEFHKYINDIPDYTFKITEYKNILIK